MMSKMHKALQKAQRQESLKPYSVSSRNSGKLGNSWLLWFFIVGIVLTVLIAFNYQGQKDAVPLAEIFPEEETLPIDVEYEFVDTEDAKQAIQEVAAPTKEAVKETAAATVPKPVVEEVKENTAPAKPKAVEEIDLSQIAFTIQVASSKDKARAEEELAKIIEKDYDAFLVSKDLGEKGTWHRIYIGRYSSKEEAQKNLEQVQQDYKNSFIISPK